MKKYFFVILAVLFIETVSGQDTFYYPNGSKINFPFRTINDILDSMRIKHTTEFYSESGSVYFKKFTNKPVLVILSKPDPTLIKSLIASFNYKRYLYSTTYYFDLRRMFNNNDLNQNFLTTNFGPPTKYEKIEENISIWYYYDYNLSVKFRDTVPIYFELVNYKAISRYNLYILPIKVTGDDYSIGFSLTLFNLSTKRIKYLYITVKVFNPVNDLIGQKIVRAIGPIETNDRGDYSFENVLYSRVATSIRIENIKLEYFDGTTAIVGKDAISSITKIDWSQELLKTR